MFSVSRNWLNRLAMALFILPCFSRQSFMLVWLLDSTLFSECRLRYIVLLRYFELFQKKLCKIVYYAWYHKWKNSSLRTYILFLVLNVAIHKFSFYFLIRFRTWQLHCALCIPWFIRTMTSELCVFQIFEDCWLKTYSNIYKELFT